MRTVVAQHMLGHLSEMEMRPLEVSIYKVVILR